MHLTLNAQLVLQVENLRIWEEFLLSNFFLLF